MKTKLLGVLLLIGTAAASAHPGWGIVQDSKGIVYFTDTRHVWRVTPDGRIDIAIPDVHTHELYIDPEDNLYGEHLWYVAGAREPWKHRVWQRRPDGSLSDVIPTRAGFRRHYSFVRDRVGNMYWADRGETMVIKRRSPDGTIRRHSSARFRSLERMTVRPDGTLYVMDAGDLRRVSHAGVVTTVAPGLTGRGRPASEVGRLNYHMGLWTDLQGRVYVAAAAEGLVLRVDGDAVTVAARSTAPWSPSGGMIDRDGALWILEYDNANAVRVRRLDPTGDERIFVPAASDTK